MNTPNHLNYIEIPSRDLAATKAFFTQAFGWSFQDYGPEYAAIVAQEIDGGFFKSDAVMDTANGSALVVLYSDALENALERVLEAGGTLKTPTFSFPGGRRFHFQGPTGNEYAVWSDK